MALLPLSALFEGDILELLVPVDDQDTVDSVAQAVAVHVVGRRLPGKDAPIRLRHNGKILDGDRRIGEVGVGPLAHVEAFFDE
ncbi:toluene-4-monooxygenase system B family protein [Nocardia paucivorans]|uniref:toluene-4-monooxygenase system B family protein n=1 Tax=Nocardia paucivorans TaxID=114259 RepID=UPI0002E17700|nr:toluene-4-monooxygenase system B family protein [Nocardia paucivorans]